MKWYAILKDREDNDWGTGSYDYDEAVEMAKTQDCTIIAVIKEGNDPICVGEIEVEQTKKADTYGYGVLDLLDDDEEYAYSKGYNDAVVDGVTYTVADADETGKIIEVREREDGTLFAVWGEV